MSELNLLINLASETKEIAKELIPIIVTIPIDKIPFSKYNNLEYLTHQLSELINGIAFSEDISLNELAQNNYEFLDTMRSIVLLLCSVHYLSSIIKTEELNSFRKRIDNLIETLNSPPFLQHRKRTPEDATEPPVGFLLG